MVKRKTILPKLRKLDKSNKKYKYSLKASTRYRKMAINEGIRNEANKKDAQKSKFLLPKRATHSRIYRRNKNKAACRKITKDMRYIDKKYKLNKTKKIC